MPGDRLPTLTGLRWAAAVLVFGHHLLGRYVLGNVGLPPGAGWLTRAVSYAGPWGVAFFFVLSGFVLTWSARARDTRRAFWQRRFAKIYPLHVVTLIMVVGLPSAAAAAIAAPDVLAHLTLTQVWLPGRPAYSWGNGPSWTLCAEAFFYLCWPFLVVPLRSRSARQLWWLLGLLVVAVPAVNAALATWSDRFRAEWVGYVLPPVRMAEFVAGMALALLVRRGRWAGPGLRASLLIWCAAAAASTLMPVPLAYGPVLLLPTLLVIAAATGADTAGHRTVWARPTMVYLGAVSFAFYLVHLPVLRAAGGLGLLPAGAGAPATLGVAAAVTVASLAAAVALHEAVERPMMRLLRPRAVARPQPRPSPTP
jgi:peptidoglycan/LPS O-acetylase OafA/YrhL